MVETFPRSGELKGEREAMRGRRPDDKLIVLIIHPSFAEIAAASGAERGLGRHVSGGGNQKQAPG